MLIHMYVYIYTDARVFTRVYMYSYWLLWLWGASLGMS